MAQPKDLVKREDDNIYKRCISLIAWIIYVNRGFSHSNYYEMYPAALHLAEIHISRKFGWTTEDTRNVLLYILEGRRTAAI